MKHKEVLKLLGLAIITSGVITGCNSANDVELLYGPAPMVMGGDQGIKSGENYEIDDDISEPEYNPSNDEVREVYGPAPIN